MALSKKHYKIIAAILRENKTKKDIIIGLAKYFKSDNPAFNFDQFYEVVGLED